MKHGGVGKSKESEVMKGYNSIQLTRYIKKRKAKQSKNAM
jgi:hypothetical protein